MDGACRLLLVLAMGWMAAGFGGSDVRAAEAAAEVVRESGGHEYRVGPVPDWVVERRVPKRWPGDASKGVDGAWRYWLVDAQDDYRGDVAAFYFDYVAEALNANALDQVARTSIDFNPVFQSLVLHAIDVERDGASSDRLASASITLARRETAFDTSAQANGDVSALIVLDDVRPGDRVRFRYTIRGSNPILAGVRHDSYPMAWTVPILARHVRVLYPPGTDLMVRGEGTEAPPIRDGDGWRGVDVSVRDVAAVRTEEDTPSWIPMLPSIEVSDRRDWRDVVEWARALYPTDAAIPDDLAARVERWRRITDPRERAAAALQLVQDDVRYFAVLLGESSHKPTPPTETWSRRYGDCKDKAWLLSTLLRALDIDAAPALVSFSSTRAIVDRLPAATQFDHVIVRAEIDGEVYWLDPTNGHQRGPLAHRAMPEYGAALVIAEGVTAPEPMAGAATPPNQLTVEERYVPQDDGSIRFSLRSTYVGASATHVRSLVASTGIEELSRRYADHYSKLHGELEVVAPLAVEDDPESGEVVLVESYRLLDPWGPSGGGQKVFDLEADVVREPLALGNTVRRQFPLWRRSPHEVVQIARFELPKGWALVGTPEPSKNGDAYFRHERSVEASADAVVITQRYESLAEVVPTDDVPSHLQARRDALEVLGQRLSLRLPAAAAGNERQRRMRSLMDGILDDRKPDEQR